MKVALHLHIDEDPIDQISYSGFQAIDEAFKHNFQAIAFTCHDKVVDLKKYQGYAQKKQITLIPGIEKTIHNQHVVILNATKQAEKITSFKKLKQYKQKNPQIFILAPHPFYFTKNCLGSNLTQYIDLFDGIEFNYFYHRFFNPNKKAIKIAKLYQKPLIGTADIHFLEHFTRTYTTIITSKKPVKLTPNTIVDLLKKNPLAITTKSFSTIELIQLLYNLLRL